MNDFLSSYVTLFALTIINNWFVMANQFVCVKDGQKIYLWYFIIFYFMSALIAINVIVSFVLDIYDSVASAEEENKELLVKMEEHLSGEEKRKQEEKEAQEDEQR